MKLKLLVSVCVVLFLATSVNAQKNDEDSKEFTSTILKALDPGKSFTSSDNYNELTSSNKKFVGDVLGIMNGSGSEDEKMSKVEKLKGEHKSKTEKLLGKTKAAEYQKSIEKKIKPLTRKYKLAKLFL